LIALSIEGCSSVMIAEGYPFIISKKLLKTPAKEFAVSVLRMQMQKHKALL